MTKIVSLLTLATVFAITVACQSQPETEPSSEPTTDKESVDDDRENIGEDDKKVNDHNGLGESKDNHECPPPREHQDMCAQVITYGLTADGVCCEYPTPCDVPDELESFSSQEECKEAAQKQ